MYGFIKTNCYSKEHCENKDSLACHNCVRNQAKRFDNFECEIKPLRFNTTYSSVNNSSRKSKFVWRRK